MNKKEVLPTPPAEDHPQPQVLFVDGHKVTIRYSKQENPSAVKAIKEIMVANIVPRNG